MGKVCYELEQLESEKQMRAKFRGRCHVCKEWFEPGEWIYYDKKNKTVRHSIDPDGSKNPPF